MTVYSVLRSCSPEYLALQVTTPRIHEHPHTLWGTKLSTLNPPRDHHNAQNRLGLSSSEQPPGAGAAEASHQHARAAQQPLAAAAAAPPRPRRGLHALWYRAHNPHVRHLMALHPGASHHVAGVCRVGRAVVRAGWFSRATGPGQTSRWSCRCTWAPSSQQPGQQPPPPGARCLPQQKPPWQPWRTSCGDCKGKGSRGWVEVGARQPTAWGRQDSRTQRGTKQRLHGIQQPVLGLATGFRRPGGSGFGKMMAHAVPENGTGSCTRRAADCHCPGDNSMCWYEATEQAMQADPGCSEALSGRCTHAWSRARCRPRAYMAAVMVHPPAAPTASISLAWVEPHCSSGTARGQRCRLRGGP